MNTEHYMTPLVSDRESTAKSLEDAVLERRTQELLSTVLSVNSLQMFWVDTSSAKVLFYAALPFRSAG